MPAEIRMPVSTVRDIPEVDFDIGRNPVEKQDVGGKRHDFNREYQRQIDARNDRRIQDQAQERQRVNGRNEDVQADKARRLDADRREDRLQARRESGNRLPDRDVDRPRQPVRDDRNQPVERKRVDRTDETATRSPRKDTSDKADSRNASRATADRVTKSVEKTPHQTVVEQHAGSNNSKEPSPNLDKKGETGANEALVEINEGPNVTDILASVESQVKQTSVEDAVTEDEISSYVLQQLTDSVVPTEKEQVVASVTSQVTPQVAPQEVQQDTHTEGAKTIAQWMQQTLGLKPAAEAESTAEVRVLGEQNAAKTTISKTDVSDPQVKTTVVQNNNKEANVLLADTSPENLDATSAEDVGREGEDPLLRLKSFTQSVLASQTTPLAQAIGSANRNQASTQTGSRSEPVSVNQATAGPGMSEDGLTLDGLKQMMQERKALLEGAISSAKAEGGDAMMSSADKLLALDKRLAGGMDALKQLRIPGADAKSSAVDDSLAGIKSSPFARTLENISSIKGDDLKPFSTSINTPLNKPGFVPEFNQRIMMMIGQKIQSAEIQLNPEELGKIDVTIKFNQDQQASIVFASQSAVTREALEQGANRLRESLEQNGIDLESVDIQENLANGRHDEGEDDAELAAGSGSERAGGQVSADVEDSEEAVVMLETDRLVDFYA